MPFVVLPKMLQCLWLRCKLVATGVEGVKHAAVIVMLMGPYEHTISILCETKILEFRFLVDGKDCDGHLM